MPTLCRADMNLVPKCKEAVKNAKAAITSQRRQIANQQHQDGERAQQQQDGAPSEFAVDDKLEIEAITGYRKSDPLPARSRPQAVQRVIQ